MQKNKFIHPDIKAVCSSATKKLVTMGLLVATVGSAVIPNIAQAQFDPNAGFYNTGEEKKETPDGDENQNEENKPSNSENMSLQIQKTKDGRKYVVIPSGVTAWLEDDDAIANVSENGYAVIQDGGMARAGEGAHIILAHAAQFTLLDKDGNRRTFVYRAPNEFLEITSSDLSTLKDQEPFSLTRPLPVSPCPAPPHPTLDENGSVSTRSFVQFLLALPKWIEDVANTFKFDPNEAVIDTSRVFYQTVQAKFKK